MRAALQPAPEARRHISIEIVDTLSPADLNDLCDVTDAAIETGGGFGWIKIPARDLLEKYWKGVLIMPERHLLVARQDGVICGATQLIEPTRHNEAQSFAATLLATFVAPFARGHGAGRRLVETAESLAASMGYKVLNLDVRETHGHAVRLFETAGFRRWGTNPAYAFVEGKFVAGHFYSKNIAPKTAGKADDPSL